MTWRIEKKIDFAHGTNLLLVDRSWFTSAYQLFDFHLTASVPATLLLPLHPPVNWLLFLSHVHLPSKFIYLFIYFLCFHQSLVLWLIRCLSDGGPSRCFHLCLRPPEHETNHFSGRPRRAWTGPAPASVPAEDSLVTPTINELEDFQPVRDREGRTEWGGGRLEGGEYT